MPKGCQKGNNIDAKTNPKSMPKYVSANIMKIRKDQVFLNGKIIQIHCKTNIFEGFAGCVCERKRYQTPSSMKVNSILKSIQNRCENDAQKR